MKEGGSFKDLLEDISSRSPAPGGGSVAALSGCFGASLISMVCNLTIGKKRYKDVEEEFKIILGESQELRGVLLDLSNKDILAFNEVMAAYKLPDGEEKTKALEKAYQNAASVPHETAVNCLRLIELAKVTARSGNKNTISDSAVGALMAFAGVKGAILNVKINLKYIEDAEFKSKLTNEITAIENKGHNILKEIMNNVDSELTL
jgi:formiminotetrahydrofolate cyclodeaminase